MALENLSSIPVWLSDSLCRLATGGGFSTRELYSDGEEKLFDSQRPVLLNGIVEVVTRPDLADRAVAITLPSIPEEKRAAESDFWPRFSQARPRILGALLDLVSSALRRLPATTLDRLPRMADFALWATAALGDGFMDAYAGNRAGLNETALETCPIVPYLLILLEQNSGRWEGTAGKLLEALNGLATDDAKRQKGWPTKGHIISGLLRRVAPNLRQTGIYIEFDRESTTARRRIIRITRTVPRNSVQSVRERPEPDAATTCDTGASVQGASEAASRASRKRPPETLKFPEETHRSDALDALDASIPPHSASEEVCEWSA